MPRTRAAPSPGSSATSAPLRPDPQFRPSQQRDLSPSQSPSPYPPDLQAFSPHYARQPSSVYSSPEGTLEGAAAQQAQSLRRDPTKGAEDWAAAYLHSLRQANNPFYITTPNDGPRKSSSVYSSPSQPATAATQQASLRRDPLMSAEDWVRWHTQSMRAPNDLNHYSQHDNASWETVPWREIDPEEPCDYLGLDKYLPS
ncbi:MAG: hypothetical protein MMC33_008170 [Icmadophila ericetorum]|nr:hypothetical protein [Icmadophila ericetorum]